MIRTVTRCRHCESIDDPALGIDLDVRAQHVRYGRRAVHLSPSQTVLLATLIAGRGQLVTHDRLMFALWGNRLEGEPDHAMGIVKCYATHLRAKLAPIHAPVAIRSVWGKGYVLELLTADENDTDDTHRHPEGALA